MKLTARPVLTGRSHGPPAKTGWGLERLDFPTDVQLRQCELGVVLKGMNKQCCATTVRNPKQNLTTFPLHGQHVIPQLKATSLGSLVSCVV